MGFPRRMILLILCLAGSLATLLSTPARAQNTINVVTTTGIVADMVKLIGGDRVQVTALMGPGVDPHLYRATATDGRTLQGADIIFYSGLHLESKLGELLEKLGSRIPTYAIGDAIPTDKLLDFAGYPGFYDPHVWFDVSLWALTTTTIEKALSDLDPDGAADHAQRAETLRKKLEALDSYVTEVIKSIPETQRLMITAHDAFKYYGRRYGIEVTGLQGISTEAEAGVEDVQRLVNLIVSRQIPAIFVESSVPRRTLEAVQEAAKARGWNVRIGGQLFSDALGDVGTLEGTYTGMVLHNTIVIATSLGGKASDLPEMLADYQALYQKAVEIGSGKAS